MKKLIGIFLLFWASGVFAQEDLCSNATPINIPNPATPSGCQINGYWFGDQERIFTMANFTTAGENLHFAKLADNNPITKTAWFVFELPNSRGLDLEVTTLTASKSKSVGFVVYRTDNCGSLGTPYSTSNEGTTKNFTTEPLEGCKKYYVQIYSTDGLLDTDEVRIKLDVKSCPTVEGDCQTAPVIVPINQWSAITDISCLTLEQNEISDCNGRNYHKSFWFEFTAPAGVLQNFRLGKWSVPNVPVAVRIFRKEGMINIPNSLGNECHFFDNDNREATYYITPQLDCRLVQATTYLAQVLIEDRCSASNLGIYPMFNYANQTQYPSFISANPLGNITNITNSIIHQDVLSVCNARPLGTCPYYYCADGSNSTGINSATSILPSFANFSLSAPRIVHIVETGSEHQLPTVLYSGNDFTSCILPNLRCGSDKAREYFYDLEAGNYTVMTYASYPYQVPLSTQITVSTPNTPIANLPSLITFTSVSNNETKTLVTENFNGTPDLSFITPCAGGCFPDGKFRKVTYTGFDLTATAKVSFNYDQQNYCSPTLGGDSYFTYKLYKDLNINPFVSADWERLKYETPIIDCTNPTCNVLEAGRYTLVLFSDFMHTKKPIDVITTPIANCSPTLHTTIATAFPLGHNPINQTNTVYMCGCNVCVWQTFTANGGTSTMPSWQTGWQNFRSTKDYDNTNVTESDLVLIDDSFTTCATLRYYSKRCSSFDNSIMAANVVTVNNIGDFYHSPVNIIMNAAGSYFATIPEVSCHTLSNGAGGYREFDTTDNFFYTTSNFQNNYKSSFFKITNSSGSGKKIKLLLSGTAVVDRYRFLYTNLSGDIVIAEGQTQQGKNGFEIECVPEGVYYVQLISLNSATGSIRLDVEATPSLLNCVNTCSSRQIYTWTGAVSDDWNNAGNWLVSGSTPASEKPDFETDVMIPNTVKIPKINGNVTAGNITINGGLIIAPTGELKLKFDWRNNSNSHNNFEGTVTFAGCIQQFLRGNTSTFSNLVVANKNHVQLDVNTQIRQHLDLKAGNLISNGKLTLLSDANGTAMVSQVGSSVVIGFVTVQRYIDGELNIPFAGAYSDPLGYHYFSSPVSGAIINQVFDLPTWKLETSAAHRFNNTTGEPAYVREFPNFYHYDENKAGAYRGTHPELRYEPFRAGWRVPINISSPIQAMKGYSANILHKETLVFNGILHNGSYAIPLTRGSEGIDRGYNLIGNPYPAPIEWAKVQQLNSNLIEGAVYVKIAKGRYSGNWAATLNGISTNGGNPLLAVGQGFMVRVKQDIPSGTLLMNNSARLTNYQVVSSARTETKPNTEKTGLLKIALKNDKEIDETAIYFEDGASKLFDSDFDAYKPETNTGITLFTQIGNEKIAINGFPNLSEADSLEIPLIFSVPENGKYTFEVNTLDFFNPKTEIYLEELPSRNKLVNLRTQSIFDFKTDKGLHTKRFVLKFMNPLPKPDSDNIIVSPNPTDSDLKIRFANDYRGEVRIRIFDMQGKAILHKQFSLVKKVGVLEHTLDISDLPRGLYILDIQTLDQKFAKKIIKQ